MTTLIHISKENIDQNSRNPNGPILPVIQAHDEQGEKFGHEAIIYGQDGRRRPGLFVILGIHCQRERLFG